MQFWPILGPYDLFKGLLRYQESTFRGSYSPKSLHKLVLPENGFISILFEAKMFENAQKVIYHAILANLGPYDPLKGPLHYQQSTFKVS